MPKPTFLRIEVLEPRQMLSGDGAGIDAPQILFIRGSDGSGGFLEGGSDEQLADITNFATNSGNHGWGMLADALEDAGFALTQVIEGTTPDEAGAPVPLAAMNLKLYDVIVFGSNNAEYTIAEVEAFEHYLRRGGGALFISDANFGSDWADASNSDQPFLDLVGIEVHQDQGTYVVGSSAGEILDPEHPIFAGVDQFDGEGVSPFHVKETIPGVTVTLLAGAEGTTRLNVPPFGSQNQGPSRATNSGDASVIAATYGAGRVVGHFDRNTFFNTNGAGTSISRFDNRQFALNVFGWLAAAEPLAGDYSFDNLVDDNDYEQWRASFGSTTELDADGNGDGVVGTADYVVWRNNVGQKTSGSGSNSTAIATETRTEGGVTITSQPTSFTTQTLTDFHHVPHRSRSNTAGEIDMDFIANRGRAAVLDAFAAWSSSKRERTAVNSSEDAPPRRGDPAALAIAWDVYESLSSHVQSESPGPR